MSTLAIGLAHFELRRRAARRVSRTEDTIGLLTFSFNVTLDGSSTTRRIADDETHAIFTRLMDEGRGGAVGRVTYEMMESYSPAVARGDAEATAGDARVARSSSRASRRRHGALDARTSPGSAATTSPDLQGRRTKLKDATPNGVLVGSGKLATELDRLDLIDEYKLLVHPRIAGHGPTLYESGLPSTRRRLELISAKPLRSGAVAMHYRARADSEMGHVA